MDNDKKLSILRSLIFRNCQILADDCLWNCMGPIYGLICNIQKKTWSIYPTATHPGKNWCFCWFRPWNFKIPTGSWEGGEWDHLTGLWNSHGFTLNFHNMLLREKQRWGSTKKTYIVTVHVHICSQISDLSRNFTHICCRPTHRFTRLWLRWHAWTSRVPTGAEKRGLRASVKLKFVPVKYDINECV